MRQYDCTKITGDKYGAQWVVEAFAQRGGRYVQSELDRSAVYMNALPIFTSGRARLFASAASNRNQSETVIRYN
jgi:hypothetical protein